MHKESGHFQFFISISKVKEAFKQGRFPGAGADRHLLLLLVSLELL